MENKENLVASLGYPPLQPVMSLRSIAHLFGNSKNRCGIYLIEFSSSIFYIGKAVDVIRRFSQHRNNHTDIIGFSFISTPKIKLDEIEKKLIYEAENLGFLLSNVVHTTHVAGDTDFDLVMSRERQELWSQHPETVNEAEDSTTINLPDSFAYRSRKQYEEFIEHPNSDEVINLLSTYVSCCIPLPKRTEYSFWSLSCMPSTRRRLGPALAVFNMSRMETFVIGRMAGSDNELYGYINVASDILKQNKQWRMKIEGWDVLAFSEILGYRYKHAGQHQLTLAAFGVDNISRLLSDCSAKQASAEFNLRLMRKRASLNYKTHCIDLARQIVMEELALYKLDSPAPSTSNTLAR